MHIISQGLIAARRARHVRFGWLFRKSKYVAVSSVVLILYHIRSYLALNVENECDHLSSVITPRHFASCPSNLNAGSCGPSSSAAAFANSCVFKYGNPVFENVSGLLLRTSRFKSCAVVSSSASLLRSKCGLRIDGHDVVFRINMAPVKGYARDVGLRTSFDTLNSHLARQLSESSKKFDSRLVDTICSSSSSYLLFHDEWLRKGEDQRDHQISLMLNGKCPREGKQRVYLVDRNFTGAVGIREKYGVGAVGEFFEMLSRAHELEGVRGPTSGFMTIMLAFTICDSLTLFGFGRQVDPLQQHYFDERGVEKKDAFHMFHEIDVENKAIKSWSEVGHVTTCGAPSMT